MIMKTIEKPIFLKRCKDFETCRKSKNGCVGCNVWYYLYNIGALLKWCKVHNTDFMQYTMKMHKHLKDND